MQHFEVRLRCGILSRFVSTYSSECSLSLVFFMFNLFNMVTNDWWEDYLNVKYAKVNQEI